MVSGSDFMEVYLGCCESSKAVIYLFVCIFFSSLSSFCSRLFIGMFLVISGNNSLNF